MKHVCHLTAAACLLAGAFVAGCATPPRSEYVPTEEKGVVTTELTEYDYDQAVEGIAKEMLERGLPKGYVVALGPVDTRDCSNDVRVRQLQKSLQVILNKEGTLKFTAAIDASRGDVANTEDSAGQIYKLIEYNWNNQNPMDAEDLQKFGKLANINGILFGRVSCSEHRLSGGGTQVTYRFVWELANTKTGVIDISHEKKITKNIR